MEPEQAQQEQEVAVDARRSVWNTVTPLSKYLAMALFIILPFVGGYLGYTLAPEKVIEIEKIIQIEKEVETTQTQQSEQTTESNVPLLQYQTISIGGENFGGELNNPNIFSFNDESFYISGEARYSVADGTFEQFLTDYGLFKGWIRLGDQIFALTAVELGTWQLSPMPDTVDVGSFQVIGSDYAIDRNNVYYQVGVLENAKVEDFILRDGEPLGQYPIGVSNSQVFYRGELLNGINGSSFVIEPITDGQTESFYIQDGDVIYINRPVCTWESLERGDMSDIENYDPVCARAKIGE
jgi:hypothetical protein